MLAALLLQADGVVNIFNFAVRHDQRLWDRNQIAILVCILDTCMLRFVQRYVCKVCTCTDLPL